ncbi:hypothetical protein [Niveispirillum irakense]|uniref:hypothetical protein n=1 Tax=Niveispirillum irakense TaxID=34011 RepID=UPI000409D821|nr:hypothetical protein [Niveispirillum irakense]
MRQVLKDIEAEELPDALRRLGIQPKQRLQVIVDTDQDEEPDITAMNAAGGAFTWLDEEPELYSDDDLIERFKP